ncbi:hypothetical protein HYD98_00940 [Mycoplasmopsis bovis]|nr:hypothetical protein [Mycoplasmopsis bovis]QQH29177.1 hypothetical protein HYD98_00940 [Mycoplasmopsis bovis]
MFYQIKKKSFEQKKHKGISNTETKYLLLVSIERPDLVSAQDINLISESKLKRLAMLEVPVMLEDPIVKLRADENLI